MRVLYYHQYFSTPRGAGGIRSYQFARRLIERGHQVTMVCGSCYSCGFSGEFHRGKREGLVDGIKVIEFNLPYSNYYSLMRRSFTFLRFALQSAFIPSAQNYDVMFASSTPLTAGIPGIVTRLYSNKPFVFEVRDLWPELPREMGVITNPVVLKRLDWLERATYRSADGYIGLAPGLVRGINRHNRRKNRIAMIPNGCDLDLFGNRAPLRPDGVEEHDLVAIFSGAHGIANGLDAVLDAAQVLKKRERNDIKLVLIGDGKLKPHLQKRAAEEGLNNCLFLDRLPKMELANLLQGVDVGMQILANVPAFYDGTSPNKFFDYLASGLPILNNYPGWLAELVKQYKCGLAVPPDDPSAFANGLEYLADHRVELKQMGKNARKLAEERFDRKRLTDKFVDFLEEIANTKQTA